MSDSFNEGSKAGRVPDASGVVDLVMTPGGFSVRSARKIDAAISMLSRLQDVQLINTRDHNSREVQLIEEQLNALDVLVQFTGDKTEPVGLRGDVDFVALHAVYVADREMQEKGLLAGDPRALGRLKALAWLFGDEEGF